MKRNNLSRLYIAVLSDIIRLIVRLQWAWKNENRSEFLVKFRITKLLPTGELRRAIKLNSFFPYHGYVGRPETMERYRNINARLARKETSTEEVYRGDHLCIECHGTGLVESGQ